MSFRNGLDDRTMEPLDPNHALAQGRGFLRLDPREAAAAQANGALIVDIRPGRTRRVDGEVPGALVVSGPVREWRLAPDSPERVCHAGPDLTVIVLGDGGPASMLAASALQGHGVTGATDVIGGFPAWLALGLPVSDGFTLAGRYVDALPRAIVDVPA